MKVSKEQIFLDDDPDNGFEIRVKRSDLTEDATPPSEVLIEMPSGENISFERMGTVIDENDQRVYWSYWNDAVDEPINLQVY